MKPQITGLRVGGVLFGLMALAQLLRLVIRPAVMIGSFSVPLWPSVVAFLILAAMSVWMLELSAQPNSEPKGFST